MRGMIAACLMVSAVAGAPGLGAADLPRVDVVQAVDGECRFRYVLEAGETRVVYCDLSDSKLGKFSVVVETGSVDVPGWVQDTFQVPAGAFVVLRNDARWRRRGSAAIRALARP
jgi:hypothetical protein